MNNKRNRITLKDVANRVGYSVNTVSKALRDSSTLPAGTKAIIRATATEMGYIRNDSANSLRSGSTGTIALIVSDIANPLFSIFAKEVETIAQLDNYSVLVINTEEDEEREIRAIHTAISKNVDGVLLFQAQKRTKSYELLQSLGIACVLIWRVYDQQICDAICVDDDGGGYLAGKRLLEGGCRKLLLLNAPLSISSAKSRQNGFMRALQEKNFDRVCIRNCDSVLKHCANVVEELFSQENHPDGIFCFNDIMAYETISALMRLGLRIPQEVAIIGFDDIQSDIPIPFPLTSIGVSKQRLASEAFSLLLRRMNGDLKDFPVHITLPTKITERASV